jgi:hypothetical protein
LTGSYTNQYSSYAGEARSGLTYGVAYLDAFNGFNPIEIDLPAGYGSPLSIAVSNTTYTALTMLNGDAFGFAQPFGQGDYFKLTIEGLDMDGSVTGTVEHYLADYRGEPGTHFIQTEWQDLDLTTLRAGVDRLSFGLESSDTGVGGMNTPAYLAVDDLILGVGAVPEPSHYALFSGMLCLIFVLRRRR